MVTLNMVRTGPRDGETVLLLHSAGLDLTYWDQQIPALRDAYDVVAVDLPGHGRSPGTPQDLQVMTIAERVAQVVRDLDAVTVHLVGLSVGGVIAQTVATQAPELVDTLVLIDSGACFAPPAQTAMRARAATLRRDGLDGVLDGLFTHWFLPETLLHRPELVDRATKTLAGLDNEIHAELWDMIAGFDGRNKLSDIRAPTTVLVGEHDSSSPIDTATDLARGIDGARLAIVPGAAHLSPIERASEVNALVRAALSTRAG